MNKRFLSCIIILLFLLPAIAQQDKTKQSSNEKVMPSLELPKVRFHKPKLTLQDALKKAENFVSTNNIPIDEYYLFQARFILYGGEKNGQPGWHFWWVHQEGALGNYVVIFVSMEGEIQRLTSM